MDSYGHRLLLNIQGESTRPQEMRNNGIACNTITYNTMLDACAKCGCMEKASMLLEDMRETSIDPDIITYSTIIKGYCLAGDPIAERFRQISPPGRHGFNIQRWQVGSSSTAAITGWFWYVCSLCMFFLGCFTCVCCETMLNSGVPRQTLGHVFRCF